MAGYPLTREPRACARLRREESSRLAEVSAVPVAARRRGGREAVAAGGGRGRADASGRSVRRPSSRSSRRGGLLLLRGSRRAIGAAARESGGARTASRRPRGDGGRPHQPVADRQASRVRRSRRPISRAAAPSRFAAADFASALTQLRGRRGRAPGRSGRAQQSRSDARASESRAGGDSAGSSRQCGSPRRNGPIGSTSLGRAASPATGPALSRTIAQPIGFSRTTTPRSSILRWPCGRPDGRRRRMPVLERVMAAGAGRSVLRADGGADLRRARSARGSGRRATGNS